VNGNWFSWNGSHNGGAITDAYGDRNIPDGPERFRDAYRHIIEIFWEERADNVTWFYHVNGGSAPNEDWNSMKSYYPGDDYIDWIGVSVYGPQKPGDGWVSFQEGLDAAIMELSHISLNKPLAILEFGTIDGPDVSSKSMWIKDALNYITSDKYPRIKAISYWHSKWDNDNGVSDMRLDSTPESLQSYQDVISSGFFISEPVFAK
jgi:beta-mannanase